MDQHPETWTSRLWRAWERFWFSPADPTKLGLIRICCGILVVYSLVAYSYHLDEFLGPQAWFSLNTRLEMVRGVPIFDKPWGPFPSPPRLPRNEQEKRYLDAFVAEFKVAPPAPYPRNDQEMDYCHRFYRHYKFDLRYFGLPPPQTDKEELFLQKFASTYGEPPAPPYPKDEAEEEKIFASMTRYHVDPHRLLATGIPVWSLWFYVTDPAQMRLLHAIALIIAVLFTIGLGTRITAALTWFLYLNYVHRSPVTLFGFDTMVNIVLLYLMIGPSGAALSVDRWLQRLRGRTGSAPQPSVGANFATRLLQIHLCIIYLVAGLAKLKGSSWWNGTAVWGSFADFELSPITNPAYVAMLRLLAVNEVVFYTFLFVSTYFTLAFEIGYSFLIWRPGLRRFILAAAFVMHGLIGVLMGLTTFSLIMFTMNLAFLTDSEARWLVGLAFPQKKLAEQAFSPGQQTSPAV